jgi:hypothetical protein
MNDRNCALIDSDLENVSGGEVKLGGYTYCNNPGAREGLYIGGCPMTMGRWIWQSISAVLRAQ